MQEGIDTTPGVYPGISPVKSGVLKPRKYLTMGQYICGDTMTTHNNSIANLTRGVGERVLYTDRNCTPCIPATSGIFDQRCTSFLLATAKAVGRHAPVTYEQFVGYYSGRRRTIYAKAVEGLAVKPVLPRDATLSTFVKAEKVNWTNKPDPAPRVIQPRNPRYNVELGRYLLPIEKKVYKAIDEVFGTPTIMSCYNSVDLANILREKWERFDKPVCVGMDASRFDQHVSTQALRFEHELYYRIFGRQPFLKQILSWQLDNRGIALASDGKFRYRKRGSRMSGDMNTSLGNKFLMCAMAHAYIQHLGIKIDFANNGDDCLLFLEAKHLHKLADLQQYFSSFGFKIVTEAPVYEFEHVEFCQTKPLYCNGMWRMVRNVKTCLLKDVTNVLVGHDIQCYRGWLRDVGNCGLAFAGDAPVFHAFYRMLIRFGNDSKYNGHDAIWNAYGRLSRNMSMDFKSPDAKGRYSFWIQTGISPDAQVELENYFNLAVWGGDKRQFIYNLETLLK